MGVFQAKGWGSKSSFPPPNSTEHKLVCRDIRFFAGLSLDPWGCGGFGAKFWPNSCLRQMPEPNIQPANSILKFDSNRNRICCSSAGDGCLDKRDAVWVLVSVLESHSKASGSVSEAIQKVSFDDDDDDDDGGGGGGGVGLFLLEIGIR